jgi:hypothetical protein
MPDETAPSSGTLLPISLMYFCSGQPMHFCSGVDKFRHFATRSRSGICVKMTVKVRWNRMLDQALIAMFLFFSNGLGLAGSILVSVLLSLVLLYACSHG